MEMNDLPRSLLGYDREEVDGLLAAEHRRLRLAEAEAKRLGAKLDDRDRRLKTALEELDAARKAAAAKGRARSPIDAGIPSRADDEQEEGLRRVAAVIRDEARRTTAKLGARAMRDTERVVSRALSLTRLAEALGAAGLDEDEPPPRRPTGQTDPARGVFDGEVEVEVGPLRDFAQLSGFEDAVSAIGETGKVEVKRFSGGRATLAVSIDKPVALLRELEQRAPLGFRVREAAAGRVVLDVAEKGGRAAA